MEEKREGMESRKSSLERSSDHPSGWNSAVSMPGLRIAHAGGWESMLTTMGVIADIDELAD